MSVKLRRRTLSLRAFAADRSGASAVTLGLMLIGFVPLCALGADTALLINANSAVSYAAKVACDRAAVFVASNPDATVSQAQSVVVEAAPNDFSGVGLDYTDGGAVAIAFGGPTSLSATASVAHNTAFGGVLGAGQVAVSATASCTRPAAGLVPGSFVFEESFENPVITSPLGWDYYASLPGWTTFSGSGAELQDVRTGGDAKHGAQFLELDTYENSAIDRTFGLMPGRYEILYWYRSEFWNVPEPDSHWLRVCLELSASPRCTNALDEITGAADWTEKMHEFRVVTGGQYRLSLIALGTSDGSGGQLDHVRIRYVGA